VTKFRRSRIVPSSGNFCSHNTYTSFMSEVASVAPPPPPPPPVATETPSYDFGKPFSYVFDDPRWVNKILIGGLFYLAGFMIIGWFFVLGYMARTARNVIRG